jgi:hypothetical protein
MANRKHPPLESIQVSLNLKDDHPYVQLSSRSSEVWDAQEILWKISGDSPVKDFRFFRESVHFTANAACFIYPEAHVHERSFRIYNTHTISGDCTYTLMVEYQGKYYITAPTKTVGEGIGDPVIHNR